CGACAGHAPRHLRRARARRPPRAAAGADGALARRPRDPVRLPRRIDAGAGRLRTPHVGQRHAGLGEGGVGVATTTGASTTASVLDGWKAQGIRFVRFELPDMHGTSRTKMVPIERAHAYAESGLNMYGGVAVLDSRSDVVGGTLYNEEIAYGDQLLRPDPETAAAVALCGGGERSMCDSSWADGTPLEALPRRVFRRQLERARAMGYE